MYLALILTISLSVASIHLSSGADDDDAYQLLSNTNRRRSYQNLDSDEILDSRAKQELRRLIKSDISRWNSLFNDYLAEPNNRRRSQRRNNKRPQEYDRKSYKRNDLYKEPFEYKPPSNENPNNWDYPYPDYAKSEYNRINMRTIGCNQWTGGKFPSCSQGASESLKFSNGLYYGEISLGTPKQTFKMLFYSLSADFWVPSINWANASVPKSSKKLYNPSASSSSNATNSNWTFVYETSPVSGLIVFDTLNINGLVIKKQVFGQALNLAPLFEFSPFDGLFGLGLQSTSIFNAYGNTPLTNMFQQGLIKRNIFSYWLNSNTLSSRIGELIFGGINSNLLTGPLTFVPLSSPSMWQITFDSMSLGSKNLAKNRIAYADTGLLCLLTPTDVYQNISTALGFNETLKFLSTINFDLKAMSFTVTTTNYGQKTLTLEPKYYILDNTDGTCSACIQPFSLQDAFVLGNVFFKKYYTVFDIENKRLGFANSVSLY